MQYRLPIIVGFLLFFSVAIQAQTINPAGLYQNSFSGGTTAGIELVLIRKAQDQSGLYRIANVRGRGYLAAIDTAGQITVEGYGVVGSFSSADTAQFTISDGIPSQFQLIRIALTDSNFLDYNQLSSPINPLYTDTWDGTEKLYDPVTGVELDDSPFLFNSVLSAETTTDGDEGLRSTESIGTLQNGYFQGTMQTQRDYVVQIGDRPNFHADPELAMHTIPANETSFTVRFIGRGEFEDINTFTNTIVVENRQFSPLPPAVKMALFTQTLKRRNPLVPGDFDGNGQVGESDRSEIMALYGLDVSWATYDLLADIDTNGVIDFRDSSALDGINTETVTINAGFSGSWFDTERGGEGWNLQILPNNRAIVAFFTYTPDGSAQSWSIGVGEIVGKEIIFSNQQITSGTVFGDQFDPNDVVRTNWGDTRIYFTDCNTGVISYAAHGEYDNNARQVSRLTNLAGLGCGQTPPTPDVSQSISGPWFWQDHDGEGLILEGLANNKVVLFWYTFDVQGGGQYWMTSVGDYDSATHTVQFDELTTTSGTAFGDDFVSSDVNRIPWGSASFVQTSCDEAVFNFDSTIAGFGSGSYPQVRISALASLDCDPDQFTQ